MKIIFGLVVFLLAVSARSEEAGGKANLITEKKINFGFIPDTAPIAEWGVNRGGSSVPTGFCGKLYNHLFSREGLKKITAFEIRYPERFNRFDIAKETLSERGLYGIECEAATVNEKRRSCLKSDSDFCDHGIDSWLEHNGGYNGTFSEIFYTSEIAIILKENKLEELNGSGPKLKLGMLGPEPEDLTTIDIYDIFEGRFSDPLVWNDRGEIKDALLSGEIDAYASDKILLEDLLYYYDRGEGEDFGYTLRANGFVVHADSFSEEPYGVVVYGDSKSGDNELLSLVNKWIKSESGRKARKDIYNASARNEDKYLEYEKEIRNQSLKVILFRVVALLFLLCGLLVWFFRKRFLGAWASFKDKVESFLSAGSTVLIILPKNCTKSDFLSLMEEEVSGVRRRVVGPSKNLGGMGNAEISEDVNSLKNLVVTKYVGGFAAEAGQRTVKLLEIIFRRKD